MIAELLVVSVAGCICISTCPYFIAIWIQQKGFYGNWRRDPGERRVALTVGNECLSEGVRVYCRRSDSERYQVLAAGVSLPTCKDLTRWKDLARLPAARSLSSSSRRRVRRVAVSCCCGSRYSAAVPGMMNARTVAELTIIVTNHLVLAATPSFCKSLLRPFTSH